MICPSCSHENPDSNRFCGGCGSRVQLQAARPGAVDDDAERRQLTVMFCDLVGSTELSERLDAEELREVVRSYQQACADAVEPLEGHIAQYLGDGLLVYFGYPQAHEDDAVRALHAALVFLDALPGTNERLRERVSALAAPVQVRIGVHTGRVVAGEIGAGERREHLAIGDTVNLAARLQSVAGPNQVVVSDATRSLVEGRFEFDELGPQPLKGIESPVLAFRVLRPTGITSRLELAGATGLTPLVGREREIGLLLDRWKQVCEGHGQVVLVSGDAGIGKSRLMQILHERLADEPHSWLEARGSAYHQNSALYPLIELIEQVLLFREDAADEKVARLEAALERGGFSVPEVLPLFATLLSIPPPERYAPLQLSPPMQRQRTLESLIAWLFSLGGEQPLVLVVEDLHWIDPSTLELLAMLLEQVPTVPVLVLLTFRPDFEPPWAGQSDLVQLTLEPLARKEIEAMVKQIAGERALPTQVLEQVVTRTDGVPLFAEELTKTVLESDLLQEGDRNYARSDPLPQRAIPSTLQDSLMARLDRLGPAKGVAQLGAVLGRQFSYELLAAVSPLEAPSLERALGDLAGAQLLHPRGVPPRATYMFKHALVQDTAYESLLKSARLSLHGRIAEVLEKEFEEEARKHPELVANHYDCADRVTDALPYYQQAADAARARSAYTEAIAHLERGVELTWRLPEGTERDQSELALQLSLGRARSISEGYAAKDTARPWERARALSQAVGSRSSLVAATRGLMALYQNRSEIGPAIELAEQLAVLARESGNDVDLMAAHASLGVCRVLQGRFRQGLDALEAALAIYAPDGNAPSAPTRGMNWGVLGYSYSPEPLGILGYVERAAAFSEAMVEHARVLQHPYSLAFLLTSAGREYLRQRQWDDCARHAEEALELSQRYGFPFTLGLSQLCCALAAAATRSDDTIAAATEGFHTVVEGSQNGEPEVRWMLARVHQELGHDAAAARIVDAALSSPARSGQPFWDAELLRLKGELLIPRDESEAESHLRRALAVAKRQRARSLELQAANTLARLWRGQGRNDEARALLAPVYDWFTEGFDTQDLKDAKALLDELT